MRKILKILLRSYAKRVLRRYQPKVIGVTGSVGKTTAKEAIYKVISKKYRTWRNEENCNNEIGVPMTVLGLKMRGKLGWIANLFRGFRLAYGTPINYPEVLVLELAADKPGDIDYLVEMVRPQVGVVIAVGEIPVHVEYYASPEEVAKEKGILIENLPSFGLSVLNYDDQTVLDMKEKSKAKVTTFGFADRADIRATEKFLFYENDDMGVSFKVHHNESFVPFRVKGMISYHQVYSVLAAAAVGLNYGMNLIQISEIFREFETPSGRMKLTPGIKDSLVIDDTYNASPESTHAALEALNNIAKHRNARRVAVLGDMLELGQYSVTAHQKIGNFAAKNTDLLICVGPRAKFIADAAENQMNKDMVLSYHTAEEAKRIVQSRMEQGDVVLVKGSRAVRMEKIVEEIKRM